MLLSIITINYNNARGLQKTVESVLSQSATDFEYLIIDGGSTDGSVEVIRQYADRIQYWVSEPDRGIYHAMNKGIRAARGTYCQFLNSGDYLLTPNVTEQMITNLPDCSILYGNLMQRVAGKITVERSYAGRPPTLMDLYRSTLFHASAYIRRSLFDQYGLYDESLRIVSDWKFYLITVGLNNEKVAYRDVDVAWFDKTGISSTDLRLVEEERARVLQELLPSCIQSDYEEFRIDGVILRRLRQHKLIWFFVRTTYRLLFGLDRLIRHVKPGLSEPPAPESGDLSQVKRLKTNSLPVVS